MYAEYPPQAELGISTIARFPSNSGQECLLQFKSARIRGCARDPWNNRRSDPYPITQSLETTVSIVTNHAPCGLSE